ncbi:hypothetical protein [Acidianus sp. HS-5]|uniref:hypothetical protein n=1 Tax=Acidianus sp. HS-5 TaxID=2886040 RepID=UPI001F3217C0|nr:hypothetical protein [Acidianus sp. HS-5]
MNLRLNLVIISMIFFFIISIPLDFLLPSVIGAEATTIIDAAIYIILASLSFFLIFFKDFY